MVKFEQIILLTEEAMVKIFDSLEDYQLYKRCKARPTERWLIMQRQQLQKRAEKEIDRIYELPRGMARGYLEIIGNPDRLLQSDMPTPNMIELLKNRKTVANMTVHEARGVRYTSLKTSDKVVQIKSDISVRLTSQ